MIKKIALFVLSFIFLFNTAFTQDFSKKGFQRLYEMRGDSSMINLSSFTTKGGNYFTLNAFEDNVDTIDVRALVIASFDTKGNLVNSRRIDSLDGEKIDYLINNGDILLDDDANSYSSARVINGGDNQTLIFSLDNQMQTRWGKTLNFDTERAELSLMNDTTLLVYYNGLNENAFSIAALDTMGNKVVSFKGAVTDTIMTSYLVSGTEVRVVDTSFTLVGNLSSTFGNEGFLTLVDHNFNTLRNRKYTENEHNLTITNIDISNDKSFIISGISNNEMDTLGYVSRLDSFGMPIWSKKLNTNLNSFTDQTTSVTGQAVNSDGDIYLSGYISSLAADSTVLYIAKLDFESGDVKNFYLYSTTSPLGNDIAELSSMADGGAGYSGTFVKDDHTYLGLINMSKEGESSFCGLDFDGIAFENFTLTTDTLVVTLNSGNEFSDATITTKIFNSFDIPTITPYNKSDYCPNEIINQEIGESVEGAVNYDWSPLADTTAKIIVTDVGNYPRIVSIGKDYCYNLCDTSKLERTELPKLSLNTNLDCKNQIKKYLVTSAIEDGQANFQYLWSTTETAPFISVDPGTYSLTITDKCGDSDNATIVVEEIISTLAVNVEKKYIDCKHQLIARVFGGVNELEDFIYEWSPNGESVAILDNQELGDYAVTVTDQCGDTATSNINVTEEIIDLNVTIEGSLEEYCEDGSTLLTAEISNGTFPYVYVWNTGATSESINGDELIEYSVQVTDKCGDTGSEVFSELANIEGLQWPSLFFPIRGELTNEENRTFGPKNSCEYLVPESYELHIYNRWGQEVFTSNAIEDEWDGKLKSGDNAPVDTYIFQAKYDYGDGNINAQGDITIIR